MDEEQEIQYYSPHTRIVAIDRLNQPVDRNYSGSFL